MYLLQQIGDWSWYVDIKVMWVPEVSYLCPEQNSQCAIVDDSQMFLQCSLKPGSVCFHLTEDQKIWLPNTAGE